MDRLLIEGPCKLRGHVSVGGFKNAAVAVLAATLIQDGCCCIENLPDISDVKLMRDIMTDAGIVWKSKTESTACIDTSELNTYVFDNDAMSRMRASIYFAGALLSRFGRAEVLLPGGCNFGERPIDLHIKGFEALGAKVVQEYGKLKVYAPDGLTGASVFMDTVSVGATVNIILAAVKAKGNTTIENAAKEPHIVDLANFLNNMGANIKGAGTDVIRIKGVDRLESGISYAIVQDMIEAGTFMIAAAATRGDVFVHNLIPKHMESLSAKLEEMGVGVDQGEDWIRVYDKGMLVKCSVKTMPYPGFPTDLHPQMTALMTQAEGASQMIENVWPNRFRYTDQLCRMGADIEVARSMAYIKGPSKLVGTRVEANDLRAGACLVIAALAASGQTSVGGVEYIDRGYERLVEKFKKLGASIERVEEDQ